MYKALTMHLQALQVRSCRLKSLLDMLRARSPALSGQVSGKQGFARHGPFIRTGALSMELGASL